MAPSVVFFRVCADTPEALGPGKTLTNATRTESAPGARDDERAPETRQTG